MAAQVGITMSHDAMLDSPSIAAFNSLAEEDQLKIRFRGSITLDPEVDLKQQVEMVIDERLKNTHPYFQIPAAKIFVDGVVEGGTAYLLDPYEHKPEFRGEPIWEPEILNNACAALDKVNLQIHLHVIGDAATRITLDALEQALESNGKRDARHLITHLQLVAPEDIHRFAQLGVVGVPQPFWFKIDEYYSELALPYLGKERADKQYPMQSFIDAGVIMASAGIGLLAVNRGEEWTSTSPSALLELEAGLQSLMKIYYAEAAEHFEKALQLDPDLPSGGRETRPFH